MRTPMVTRTIPTTLVTFLAVNPETKSVTEETIALPRSYKDEKALKKALDKATEKETFKAVSIIGCEVHETLYGMTEEKFIAGADVLPPRGTKETN